jgi:telomere length regulation protein
MGDLLTPLKTTRKVKSNVEELETLALSNSARSPIEVIEVSSTSRHGASKQSRHKKQDSAVFLHKSYLHNDGLYETLPDDAREILKNQPDIEEFRAVLQYLQFGIDGKHDFNIRAAGPKQSQILNVLVTVTIPERWASLSTKPISKQDQDAKNMLLSCLACVAGLGALYAHIRRLIALAVPTKAAQSLMLKDAVDVLVQVLHPPSFIASVLHDTLTLHSKAAQRQAIWQEVSSFVAGGKILSTVAQALPLAELAEKDKLSVEWLGDGSQYCKWLASNICHAATTLAANEDEAWPMLAQLVKRGINLGHSGKSTAPSLRILSIVISSETDIK